jgi:predicted HTH transcriptional regulator
MAYKYRISNTTRELLLFDFSKTEIRSPIKKILREIQKNNILTTNKLAEIIGIFQKKIKKNIRYLKRTAI